LTTIRVAGCKTLSTFCELATIGNADFVLRNSKEETTIPIAKG
jgi:hypothetical protein